MRYLVVAHVVEQAVEALLLAPREACLPCRHHAIKIAHFALARRQ
jgi:hypothetical protein